MANGKYHIEFDIDLRQNPYPGKYIVIEGIDGSGKSTQVKRLKEALEKEGKTVLETSEPNTHDAIGKLVREVLSGKETISPVAIQYLFSANRATTQTKDQIRGCGLILC
jgi:thymidylate kinase